MYSFRPLILGFLFLGMLAQPTPLHAESGVPFVEPADPDQTDIFLVTVGMGHMVADRFGHTFLRVMDHQGRRVYNFNWGVYNWDEPNFALKFYEGTLLYRVAIQSWGRTVPYYRNMERSMVQERVNLTSQQKQTLFKRLAWNARPENVQYRYHHFYNNCSTKVRDYLDEALAGAIRNGVGAEPSGRSYRDETRDAFDGLWWADIGVEITTNRLFDLQMSKWDEMFLPRFLRQHLLDQPALSDDGQPIPGQTLLSDTTTILDFPRPPRRAPPFLILAFLFGIPLAAGAVLIYRQTPLGMRLFGLGMLSLGGLSGLVGLMMLFNWTISGHTDLHHNANLWLFFPVDGMMCVYGAILMMKARLPHPGRLRRLGTWLAWAHIGAVLLCGLLWLTGFIDQDVSRTLGVFGPLIILTFGVWIWQARRDRNEPAG